MNRPRWVEHDGKRMLHLDFSNCSAEQHREGMEESMRLIAAEPPGSVLLLSDATGGEFPEPTGEVFEAYVRHNEPYMKACALVGVRGFKLSFLSRMRRLVKHPVEAFDDLEEAREWLARQ